MHKCILFGNRVISLEVFKKSELAFPPSAPCTFFCRPHLAREYDFYVFQHLCGARVLSVRFGPSPRSTRIAFDDTSNVIFVVLPLMPLKCKRRTHFVVGWCNPTILCIPVFCSFGFYMFCFMMSNNLWRHTTHQLISYIRFAYRRSMQLVNCSPNRV